MSGQYTLFHSKSLLVVTTLDLENVTLKLLPEAVTTDLSGHTLVKKGEELTVILDLETFTLTSNGVGDVQLHDKKRKKKKAKKIKNSKNFEKFF